MCKYCNPNSEQCCIWKDSLTEDFYLDIETSEWDEYDDGFVHQKEYISYCPYCGKKLDDTCHIGQWVAFRQEGMSPILHGKIIDISNNGCCKIRCKNGERRYENVNDIIKFFDNKKECYKLR